MATYDGIDPESRIPLSEILEKIPGGFNSIPDIVERRAAVSRVMSENPAPENPGIATLDFQAPGPECELTIRVFRKTGLARPSPGLVYIHGGGMIMGSIDDESSTCLRLAELLDVAILSIDYRKAPEYPYPAATEDCFAAATWIVDNAQLLELDVSNIGIYGQSAGGGLTLAVALLAKERGGPEFRYIAPIYPMIDDRNTSASSHLVADVGIWDRAASLQAWKWYLGDSEADHIAAPARAIDLSGLPHVFMDVGEFDMFRDEALDFAKRLGEAGVPVEFHLWPGAYHSSEVLAPEAPLSQRIWAARVAGIRALIG